MPHATRSHIAAGAAVLFGLGFASPVIAQDAGAAADADQDGMVSAEEARAHDEQLFQDITGGADLMTEDQFTGAVTASDEVLQEFLEADKDASGDLTVQEWTDWRGRRFRDAAGSEDGMSVDDYDALNSGKG